MTSTSRLRGAEDDHLPGSHPVADIGLVPSGLRTTLGALRARIGSGPAAPDLTVSDILKPVGPVSRTRMWNLGLLALEYTIRADSSTAPPTERRPSPFARRVPELAAVNYPAPSPLPVVIGERAPGSVGGNQANGTPRMTLGQTRLIRQADQRWLDRARAARRRQQRLS